MAEESDFNILIVDDHIQTAISISEFLENEGFRTCQAYNGVDALKKSQEEKPDLILLDIKIPKMSGFEVAEKVKTKKILFMTAYDALEKKASKFKGVLGVIKKPVNADSLAQELRKIFKIKKED